MHIIIEKSRNICKGVFVKLTALTVNYFRKTAPSLMFDRALNKLLL